MINIHTKYLYLLYLCFLREEKIKTLLLTHKFFFEVIMKFSKLPIPSRTKMSSCHVYVESNVSLTASFIVMVIGYTYRQRPFFTVVIINLVIVGRFQTVGFLQNSTKKFGGFFKNISQYKINISI